MSLIHFLLWPSPSMCRSVVGHCDWTACLRHADGCRGGQDRLAGCSNRWSEGQPWCMRTGRGRAAGKAAGRLKPITRQEMAAGELECFDSSWWWGGEQRGQSCCSAHAPNWSAEHQTRNTPSARWEIGREPRPPIPSSDGSSSSSILQEKTHVINSSYQKRKDQFNLFKLNLFNQD